MSTCPREHDGFFMDVVLKPGKSNRLKSSASMFAPSVCRLSQSQISLEPMENSLTFPLNKVLRVFSAVIPDACIVIKNVHNTLWHALSMLEHSVDCPQNL